MNLQRFLHSFLRLTVLMAFGAWAAQGVADTAYHHFATRSALADGRWVKVGLQPNAEGNVEDAVYQISYDQLRSMGFSRPEAVGVYGNGGHAIAEAINLANDDDMEEVAVWHDAAHGRLLFYGQGLTSWTYNERFDFLHRCNSYTTEAFYFLHEKTGEAPRALATQENGALSPSVILKQYHERMLHEVNLVNLGETGREMYGEDFAGSEKSQSFRFGSFDEGQIRVTMNFVSKCAKVDSVRITLGQEATFSAGIPSSSNSYAFASEATINNTFTHAANGAITARVTYLPAKDATYSNCRLNYIRLIGMRNFSRPDSYTLFRSIEAVRKTVRYDLSNALADGIEVWDVTDPHDVLRQTVADGGFVAPAVGLREYALVNTASGAFPSVYFKEEVANQNLHGLTMADMVIVSASDYLGAARRLAAFRQSHDGLVVQVVSAQEVYNEFASGAGDASAIRLLMKMFYDRYQGRAERAEADSVLREPRYLLLLGDGYFDNRSISPRSHIVSYQTDASLVETSSCTCDDYFGFLDDGEGGTTDSYGRYSISSDGLDLGVGRLTVNNKDEANAVVDKIIAYSQNKYYGSWKNRLTFLSDDDKEGDSPNCHVAHNDAMVKLLESMGRKEYVFQKIYLPAYAQTQTSAGTDYPDAKKQFQEALKQGSLLINYAGHGSTLAITNENMMTATQAKQLNMKYLPLWVTASCDVSRWDASSNSMGEELLLNPNGGAIAMISTTRVVYASQNRTLNNALLKHLFGRFDDGHHYRLGDVMKAAKRALGSDYNKLNFCLLGDPSLRLAYPEYNMKLTRITTPEGTYDVSQLPASATIPFKALNRVTVEGCVYELGSETDTCRNFNGLIYPTFYDSCDTLRADIGYFQEEGYTFAARSSKVFVGRDVIENGCFKFSFFVPQDVAYRPATGLANLYACCEDGREAQGFFDRFVLTGDTTIERSDTVAPVIHKLFLDDASFTDGVTVGRTPFFYAEVSDSSGINVTGNSIGHDITLTVRNLSNRVAAPQQFILNNYFTTYTGDSQRGNIQYSLPALQDGTYEATFRAWDVYFNAASQRFSFNVQGDKAPEAVSVQAYPSPAHTGEAVTFRVLHNRPESATTLTLQIFTQMGRKVYETTVNSSSAPRVYTTDERQPAITTINADESGDFLGSSAIEYKGTLLPGFYLYRVFISSGDSSEASHSRLLIVNP